mmetsp:Transcript_40768/g.89103  ORF Transcript_40768/g.89103 Transcript_40768/m.89103 type:complete len:468 (-) Transcript_40768:180-1583(-)
MVSVIPAILSSVFLVVSALASWGNDACPIGSQSLLQQWSRPGRVQTWANDVDEHELERSSVDRSEPNSDDSNSSLELPSTWTKWLGDHRTTLGVTDQSRLYDVELPQWIEDYAQFHARALANVTANTSFLIYQCTAETNCGGIGDRILGIVHLFYVALLSGRVLLLNYTKPFPLKGFLDENLLQWSFQGTGRDSSLSDAISIDSRGDLFNLFPFLSEPSELQAHYGHYGTVAIRLNGYNFEALWQSKAMKRHLASFGITINPTSSAPEQLIRWAFHTLFRKSTAVELRMRQLRAEMGLRDERHRREPYVGIHVRLGDQGQGWSPAGRHSLGDLDAFLKCGRRMQQVILSDGGERPGHRPIMFVASDSEKPKTLLAKQDDTIRSANVVIYHVDLSNNETEARSRSGTLSAWAEMFILSESNCIVASESGFSYVARMLSVSDQSLGPRCYARFNNCSSDQVSKYLGIAV